MKAESKKLIFWRSLGQNILHNSEIRTEILTEISINDDYSNYVIQLKQLSSISDEDAIEMGKLTYLNDPKTVDDKTYIDWVRFDLKSMDKQNHTINYKAHQFLCLKGYATPQTVIEDGKVVTYSVEELVNEGVFKLI